jgi:hypothetical protein
MTNSQMAVIVILAIAVIAAVAILIVLRNRTKKLQARFGPEYDRTVEETGSRYKAEARLKGLEKRVERYPLHPIPLADRERFQQSWRIIQTRFVDDPGRAFTEADQLLGHVMLARGYPVSDFEQRAAELSVDHGKVVEHYRAGHEIAVRRTQGAVTTEDLRRGMIHYRTLFDELLTEPERLKSHTARAS